VTVVGTLVAESLRDDAVLSDVPLTVKAIVRLAAGDLTAGQPLVWSMIEFEAPDDRFDDLVTRLVDAIRPGPWYCDVRTADDVAVVFAGRAFRYRRGDDAARAEAERFARDSGVPGGQIDWPD
jgi:hypothetical protein